MNSPSKNAGPHPRAGNGTTQKGSSIHRLSLVFYPEAVLRALCQPIEAFDSTLRDIADEMLKLMQAQRGICLAAPQVGLRHRLIVCGLEEQLFALRLERDGHSFRRLSFRPWETAAK